LETADEKQATELFFKPFGPLSKDHSPASLLQTVEELIQDEKYIGAENLCLQLIEMSLDGLRYFQTYDWLFLRSIITLGYIGWCLFGLEFVIRTYVFTNDKDQEPTVIDSFVSDILSIHSSRMHSKHVSRFHLLPLSSY
jgi:GPI ethanolamine phosphate transferase 1